MLVPEEDIRSRFPALERGHAGRPVAYFDGPGGTQVPRSVTEAMTRYLLDHNANRRWAYPTSAETDEVVARARQVLADFLGCDADDVAFGANMTSLTFHLSRTLGRHLAPGDEIVVTRLDHRANVDPWRALEQERGVVVREVPFDPRDGSLDMEALGAALNGRTRLVAVGWASNVLGTVVDVAAVVAAAREAGAWTFVDAVHAAPHFLPAARALGCDFLACSPYKFYGPHAGVLYARADVVAALDPPRLVCSGQAPPERFELGTQSHEAMAGSAAAVDFLASLSGAGDERERRSRLEAAFAGLHDRSDALVTRLWEGLEELQGVRCYGPPPGTAPRTPTVSFTVAGQDPRAVAAELAERHAVFVSHGNFYAPDIVDDLGVGGLVRAGCACYTTREEVERLLEAVSSLV